MKLYGIRDKETKKVLGVDCITNDPESESVSIQFIFYEGQYAEIPVWLVRRREEAEKALENNTPWYNADYEKPGHGSIDMSKMEVFEVRIEK